MSERKLINDCPHERKLQASVIRRLTDHFSDSRGRFQDGITDVPNDRTSFINGIDQRM